MSDDQTQPEPATKNQLLQSGRFSSIPKCILRSTALTPADKVVYAALIDRLGEHNYVFPKQKMIAKDVRAIDPSCQTCDQETKRNWLNLDRTPSSH